MARHRKGLLTIAFLALSIPIIVPHVAVADGWAIFSDHEELRGYTIADVGELDRQSKLTDDFQQVEWFAFNGRCLLLNAPTSSSLAPQAALLLVDREKNFRLAIFENAIGGVEVNVQSFRFIECPSPF